jgi:hypothetical protein
MLSSMPLASAQMPAAELARELETFLAEYPKAAVLEDGHVIFDMQAARYALSSEQGRCLLHLWSEERNLVRTVCGLHARKNSLRLETRRFGQARPQVLELLSNRDRRSPSTKEAARSRYLRVIARILERSFPEWTIDTFSTAADLENSFGPAYARGTLRRGVSAWAVIAVNAEEPQPSVDNILTLGLLWLACCREHAGGKRLFEGLRIIVPVGCARTVRARMSWLNPAAARWELYELDQPSEHLHCVDLQDSGNLDAQIAHAFNPQAALARSAVGVQELMNRLPPRHRATVELRPRSANEIAFLLHGLVFARVRHGFVAGSFTRQDEITFGAGANETVLSAETGEMFDELTSRLFESRHADGSRRDPLYRLQPERWLEGELRGELSDIEPRLDGGPVYSQVPAFAAGDRAMLDLLTVTTTGRLAIIEIKADEDLHLPAQALDYWARVRQLQCEGAFQRHGYFPGLELGSQPPLLFMVAPALRIHPSTDTVLRYFSPQIPWELIGINEDWRKRRKVILRKRSTSMPDCDHRSAAN